MQLATNSSREKSEADQILGRLERDETGVLLITGLQPFKSKKYDCTKHPRWGEISGWLPGNRQV